MGALPRPGGAVNAACAMVTRSCNMSWVTALCRKNAPAGLHFLDVVQDLCRGCAGTNARPRSPLVIKTSLWVLTPEQYQTDLHFRAALDLLCKICVFLCHSLTCNWLAIANRERMRRLDVRGFLSLEASLSSTRPRRLTVATATATATAKAIATVATSSNQPSNCMLHEQCMCLSIAIARAFAFQPL